MALTVLRRSCRCGKKKSAQPDNPGSKAITYPRLMIANIQCKFTLSVFYCGSQTEICLFLNGLQMLSCFCLFIRKLDTILMRWRWHLLLRYDTNILKI